MSKEPEFDISEAMLMADLNGGSRERDRVLDIIRKEKHEWGQGTLAWRILTNLEEQVSKGISV